ncbi:hypothetical protein CQW23_01051 [Capsicum baccatum]|uniref:Ubiquitin-like protease family profile domain-containing protein n=1 Tax=Capsicum baccatum TaxID=33114 RepID=A0A2G2XMH0_CAPBA|nr:hypothetical protein CQW23_01051 [Capsicum baccatum]
MRKRQLTYSKAYDAADRIMDLDFFKKLKDKYNQLNTDAPAYGAGLDFLVSMLDLDEKEIIKYVRGERPNLHDFSLDFATSSECSSCKCQNCKAKHDGVINAINALTASVKEMTSKRDVILSKRISYPDTPLEIKAAKKRMKDTSKASSIIKKVDVTVEATTKEHSITVHNPSTASKYEEKVEPISLGERKNYLFKGFNISNEAIRKLTQLINDYSKWITDGLLKHHVGSIPDGLPWHLINEVYIPINYGDKFHWVLAIVVLKERCIRVYNSMSRRIHFGLSSEIQKLAKILPTYLDMSGFLDQKGRTDWSMIEAYQDKMANPFDVQYADGIA